MRCDCYIPSGCAVSGIMSKAGERMDGNDIIRSIALMHDRSNGLGGGFAAYGIYPRHANEYAFHMMFDNMEVKDQCEEYFKDTFDIVLDEEIPTRPGAVFEQDTSGRSAECGTQPITSPPILWRYFMVIFNPIYIR